MSALRIPFCRACRVAQDLPRCLQLVMLGSGHPPYEAAMREQEERHPHHFRGWVGFSIPVAHRIVAGALPSFTRQRFSMTHLPRLI